MANAYPVPYVYLSAAPLAGARGSFFSFFNALIPSFSTHNRPLTIQQAMVLSAVMEIRSCAYNVMH